MGKKKTNKELIDEITDLDVESLSAIVGELSQPSNDQTQPSNDQTQPRKQQSTWKYFKRNQPYTERIYIEQTALIKERVYKDGHTEYFMKELFNYNIISALRFGRVQAKDISSYDEAVNKLYNKPKKF